MDIFVPTLNQIAYLFLLIFIGYIIIKIGVMPKNSDTVLSRMENYLFIPALVLSTFMSNFNVEKIKFYGEFFLVGFILCLVGIILAIILSKIFFKDKKIYAYGMAFSNFAFMGNAVALAIFPDLFTEYLIFVLPFWIFAYLWGVPYILSEEQNEKVTIKKRLKAFINPMIISVFVGALFGLINLNVPSFINKSITTLGSLMTPIAMIITGMTIAKIDVLKMLKKFSIYSLSLIRLIVFPIVGILLIKFLNISYNFSLCIIVVLAMPLGLNSIIVLNAYDKDISEASAMALVSHVLSIITIPLIFSIFSAIF
jgi:predicted permease